MTSIIWILESEVFPNSHTRLRSAINEAGHRIVESRDDWWLDGPPKLDEQTPIVFHGSLGNAALIEMKTNWSPGSFCPVSDFCCTAWYPKASKWLLHRDWRCLPANELVSNSDDVANSIGCAQRVFVRPDSPLKPFSGRVLEVDSISLKALDHGFYYDDETLPVVIAPVANVGREWRFVVVDGQVIAGSGYNAQMRIAATGGEDAKARSLAEEIASSIEPPSPVYVLDICVVDDECRLLELNPFGGADLYDCDTQAIVEAVSSYAMRSVKS